jgi:hypothetical protein
MKIIYTFLFLFSFFSSFGQIYTRGRIIGEDSCDFASPCAITQSYNVETNTWTRTDNSEKIILKSGYDDSFALVTDTATYYRTNSNSSFIVSKNTGENYNYTDANFMLSFYYKMNSDPGKDGGFIEVSFDNGQTWKNIVYDSTNMESTQPVFGLNLYTREQMLFNGQPGFSGDITAWTFVEVPLTMFVLLKKPRAVSFRFTFVSDSIPDEKEGWAIDNIKLSSVYIPGGLNKLNTTSSIFTTSPNPCVNELQITANTGQLTGSLSIYSIEGKLLRTKILDNIHSTDLEVKELPAGMYSIIYHDDTGTSYFKKFIKTGSL